MSDQLDNSVMAATEPHDDTEELNFELLKELLSKSKFLTKFLTDRIYAPPKAKQRRSKRRKVNRGTTDDSSEQPSLLTGGVLRPYQVEGFKWLKILFKNGVNGILGDEMGLGKTIQAIALIAHLINKGVPGLYLVCAPLSTLNNWMDELKRFTPKLPVLLYHGSIVERRTLRQKLNKEQEFDEGRSCLPIVITSYEMIIKDFTYLRNFDWMYVIVDEGHRIKNFNCILFRSLLNSCLTSLRSSNRLLLTGTPLQNNLSELWSLLHFLMPEVFDKLSIFNSWFDVSAMSEKGSDERIIKQEEGKHLLSMFHEIVSPFMLRRLKADVALFIPPKREFQIKAPFTPKQEQLYKAAINNTIAALVGKDSKASISSKVMVLQQSGTGRPKRLCTLKQDGMLPPEVVVKVADAEHNDRMFREVNVKTANNLMALRKACNHPYQIDFPIDPQTNGYQVDENLVNCSGKMIVLDTLLRLLKESGHKVLLFSQMTTMLDILQDFCYMRHYTYCRLDGNMKLQQRQTQIDQFNQDKDTFVFLVSTRVGGLGLNLTAADTVIIYDSDWNPQCDQQAMARCHRIGQTKPVVILRLVTEKSIDEKMVERAAAKRKLEKMIIHKDLFRNGNRRCAVIDPKELLEMLTSTDCSGIVYSGKDKPGELEMLLDRDFGNNHSETALDNAESSGRIRVIKEEGNNVA